jgi:hypothetical protein
MWRNAPHNSNFYDVYFAPQNMDLGVPQITLFLLVKNSVYPQTSLSGRRFYCLASRKNQVPSRFEVLTGLFSPRTSKISIKVSKAPELKVTGRSGMP